MSSGTEIASLALLALGCLMTGIAVGIPYWETNDPEDTVNDMIVSHKGIWVKCTSYRTGNWECDDFEKFFLGLPVVLQAARGFGISSICFGILGMLAMFVGMTGVSIGSDNPGDKRRIRLVGSVLGAFAGIFIIVAASWYGNQLRIEYEIATLQKLNGMLSSVRNVFGPALFIGWAGGSLSFLGGIIGFCASCQDEKEDYRYSGGVQAKPHTLNAREYV